MNDIVLFSFKIKKNKKQEGRGLPEMAFLNDPSLKVAST